MEELKLEQELQTIKEEFQKINEYIAYLSSIIRDLEQTLESSDVGFLQVSIYHFTASLICFTLNHAIHF